MSSNNIDEAVERDVPDEPEESINCITVMDEALTSKRVLNESREMTNQCNGSVEFSITLYSKTELPPLSPTGETKSVKFPRRVHHAHCHSRITEQVMISDQLPRRKIIHSSAASVKLNEISYRFSKSSQINYISDFLSTNIKSTSSPLDARPCHLAVPEKESGRLDARGNENVANVADLVYENGNSEKKRLKTNALIGGSSNSNDLNLNPKMVVTRPTLLPIHRRLSCPVASSGCRQVMKAKLGETGEPLRYLPVDEEQQSANNKVTKSSNDLAATSEMSLSERLGVLPDIGSVAPTASLHGPDKELYEAGPKLLEKSQTSTYPRTKKRSRYIYQQLGLLSEVMHNLNVYKNRKAMNIFKQSPSPPTSRHKQQSPGQKRKFFSTHKQQKTAAQTDVGDNGTIASKSNYKDTRPLPVALTDTSSQLVKSSSWPRVQKLIL